MAGHNNNVPRPMTADEKTQIEAAVEGGITPEEKLHLQTLLRELDPEDLNQFNSTIRASLDGIINELNEIQEPQLITSDESIEVQPAGNYSMEHLRENSHGFLSKLLEIEIVPGIDAMKAFMLTQGTEHIGSELLSIMPEAARTNLQILTWNKIVNSLGVSSIFKHGKSSFFSGFSGILGGEDTGNSEDTETGLSIDSFSEIADSIQNFNSGNTDQNGTLQIPEELAILNGGSTEIAVPSGIAMGFDYLESLSIGYFTNMKTLLELAQEQGVETSENFKNLLAHPQILQTILETGVYSENGMNINLENKNLFLGNVSQESIEAAGQQVMQEIIGDTNTLSGKIDGILAQTDKFVAIFEKLGIDPTALKESLFNLKGIGFIFKILFGDFLDTIEGRMSSLNEAPEVKKAMETLGKYIEDPDNKDKLPFELNEENPGEISDEETDILNGFVKKIKNAVPGEGDEKDTKIKDILENPRLARQLFTGEGILEGDVFLQKIHDGVIALFGGSVKPTQAEFFEKLKSINLTAIFSEEIVVPVEDEVPIPEEVPVDETPATSEEIVPPVESTVPNEVIETDRIPSIETQVQGITDFPSTIILEDGTEESIDYNPSTTSIEIGENSYTITSIKKYGQELLGVAFNLNSLQFLNGEGELRLDATQVGKELIGVTNQLKEQGAPDIVLEEGDILNVPLTSTDMQKLILDLIQDGKHQTQQEGIDIIVS